MRPLFIRCSVLTRSALICSVLTLGSLMTACAPGKEAASLGVPSTSASSATAMADPGEASLSDSDAPMDTTGQQDAVSTDGDNRASMKAPAMAPGLSTECKADPAQEFVGKLATEDTIVAARTAANVSSNVRVIKPGQPVTMDFRPDRLNIEVDDDNLIVRINCG